MTTRKRLLIVDDEPINIQTLYQIFRADYDVFMATSGEQALARCYSSPMPDLVLLDVMMPDMDGSEVCCRLKADPVTASIPIIFVTAKVDPTDEAHALDIGGVDFITKPVNPTVVRARVRTHLTLKAQADLLKEMVFIDGLTGVSNRRRFDEALEIEWRTCQRNNTPLTLFLVDVDYFKRYNDTYGHQAGDACLQQVATLMKQTVGLRASDIVARYGGEEFACLLPDCPLEQGLILAENLRTAVENLHIPHAASAVGEFVTVSIGVATIYHADGEKEALIAAADAGLYRAKDAGRNRVDINESQGLAD